MLIANPTQRGKGVGKERGSLEGENLRDRDRGGSPSPCSLWLSPANNSTKRTDLYSEPEKCYPTKRTIPLASLVKGEVLSPEKIRATTRGIATPTLTQKINILVTSQVQLHYHRQLKKTLKPTARFKL